MPRWYILRTLLLKELLRYRYNWGLLVVVFALVALSALVSIGARMNALPGQGGPEVTKCTVAHAGGSKWAEYLKEHPPAAKYVVEFQATDLRVSPDRWYPRPPLTILLIPSGKTSSSGKPADDASGKIEYWYSSEIPAGILPYRDWVVNESRNFFGTRPLLEEETREYSKYLDTSDIVPLILTAFVLFGLYLLSFNLYITSTAEEREKRVLLALMLSPAGHGELVIAKAIFYAIASLIVAVVLTATYNPRLLANPLLWSTVILGSVGYVAVGTVVITIVRRQTTVNTVSMLYLIATCIIMFLSKFIPLFGVLRIFLIEDKLHRQMHQIFSQQSAPDSRLNHLLLIMLVVGWSVVAVRFFAAKGKSVATSS